MDSTSPENPIKHRQKSSSDSLSSAKYVVEAAKHTMHHVFDKVDKGRVADAAADLLRSPSQYGKLEEKSFDLHQISTCKTMGDSIALQEGLYADVEKAVITSLSRQRVDYETREIHSKLYRAALEGEWDIAEGILKEHPDYVSAKISAEGDTALHTAAKSAYSTFGIKLVEKMRTEDLLTTNNAGNTAFCLAAASGIVKLAKKMLEKNENLALIQSGRSKLPVYIAALNGHKEMVSYLYEATVDRLSGEDLIELLITLIKNSIFDVALQLVEKHPNIATERDKNGETALHSLAQMPLIDPRGIVAKLLLLGVFKNLRMPPQALKLVKLLWKQVMLSSDSEIILNIIRKPWSLIFAAAKQGNLEFLKIIFDDFPDLIFEADDENHYSIFHLAVQYRHANIFSLIYDIGSWNDLVIENKDEKGNTILHLAAMLPPPDRLNAEEGIVLQLQMEVAWFQELSRILPRTVAEVKNGEGKTAEVLFNEEHKELREAGEKWIKDGANSGLVAATIVTSVTFAAVLTVPGGTQQDKGTPNLVGDSDFLMFAVCDAISLLSSSLSILLFLSIFRSPFSLANFRRWLPYQFAFAIYFLHFSVLIMLFVFSCAISILFKGGKSWIPVMVGVGVLVFEAYCCYTFLQIILVPVSQAKALFPGLLIKWSERRKTK